MRKINEIIVHCSAAKNSSARQIDNWHKKRGWDCIGYHYVVRKSGKLEKGRDINTIGAHCFPFGTDLLTPNGWKDVSLVEIEDKIACYKNNEIFFEKQIRKIKSKANVFISAIGKNYSFISTVGHEFLYKKINQKKYEKDSIQNIVKLNNVKFPVSGNLKKSTLIPFSSSENLIRLYIAIICDGSIMKRENKYIKGFQFRFWKERKIEKVINLLTKLNIKFSRCIEKDGYTRIRVFNTKLTKEFLKQFPNKELSYDLLLYSKFIRELIIDTYIFFDGSIIENYTYRTLSSVSKKNIDILQALCCLTEKRAVFSKTKHICNLNNKESEIYNMTITERTEVQISKHRFNTIKTNYEKDVFCVEVPSGNILIRNNGKHMISGNCKGNNRHSIGICIEGRGFEDFTFMQLMVLLDLIIRLKEKFGIKKVTPHYEYNENKTCPTFDVMRFFKGIL